MLGKGVHTSQSHIYVLGDALVSIYWSNFWTCRFEDYNETMAIH